MACGPAYVVRLFHRPSVVMFQLPQSRRGRCPMTVEGTPESDCLLRCGRLPRLPRL